MKILKEIKTLKDTNIRFDKDYTKEIIAERKILYLINHLSSYERRYDGVENQNKQKTTMGNGKEK